MARVGPQRHNKKICLILPEILKWNIAEICKTGTSDAYYIYSNGIIIFSSLLTVKPRTQVILTADKCSKCYPCNDTKSVAIKVDERRVTKIRTLSDK